MVSRHSQSSLLIWGSPPEIAKIVDSHKDVCFGASLIQHLTKYFDDMRAN